MISPKYKIEFDIHYFYINIETIQEVVFFFDQLKVPKATAVAQRKLSMQ